MNRVFQLVNSRRRHIRPPNRDEQTSVDMSQNHNSRIPSVNNTIRDRNQTFTDDETVVGEYDDYEEEAYVDADDDNNTMMDDSDIVSGATLGTYVSDTSTIGDLVRNGFVNNCPRFYTRRSLPFISFMLNRGFYCFPSELALNNYLQKKRTKRLFSDFNPGNDEPDVPLYHAVSTNLVKSLFSAERKSQWLQIMVIHRFQVLNTTDENFNEKLRELNDNTDETLPFVTEEPSLISENGSYRLYKHIFCVVFREVSTTDPNRIVHHFVLNNGQDEIMVSYRNRKNADIQINDLIIRWFGTTGLSSPFGSNNFKLLILDNGMPSFLKHSTLATFDTETRQKKNIMRPLGYLPTWGKYSDDNATKLPKKRIYRLADLVINETSIVMDPGVNNVPRETQILTCMAMLHHAYESRKDKRHMNPGNNRT